MTRADIRKRILADNDTAAAELRRRFDAARTLVLNLISSPGSGKTSLLEATARTLADVSAAAFVGDIATELDAERVRRAGLPAHQIGTGGACHLDARMVYAALDDAPFDDVDVLFIENVGNLVCPASFDLGEDLKIACLSVTEGWDKPFKYPGTFRKSACTVITKADMLPHVDFDVEKVRQQVLTLNPDARVFVTSSVTGEGLDAWCTMITDALAARRERAADPGRAVAIGAAGK